LQQNASGFLSPLNQSALSLSVGSIYDPPSSATAGPFSCQRSTARSSRALCDSFLQATPARLPFLSPYRQKAAFPSRLRRISVVSKLAKPQLKSVLFLRLLLASVALSSTSFLAARPHAFHSAPMFRRLSSPPPFPHGNVSGLLLAVHEGTRALTSSANSTDASGRTHHLCASTVVDQLPFPPPALARLPVLFFFLFLFLRGVVEFFSFHDRLSRAEGFLNSSWNLNCPKDRFFLSTDEGWNFSFLYFLVRAKGSSGPPSCSDVACRVVRDV